MKKFVIIGNYGAGNWGDDLLCLSTIKGIQDQFKGADIKVLAANPDLAKKNCGVENIEFLHLFPAGVRSFFNYTFSGKLKKTTAAVKAADVVVFGGGGLLNAEVPRSMSIWGKQIMKAAKLGRRIAMLGQSFPKENLEEHKATFMRLINKVEFVTVRDPISYDVLTKLKAKTIVKKAADLVTALDLNFVRAEVAEELVINFRFYDGIDDEVLLRRAVSIVKFILKHTEFKLKFVCMDQEDCVFAELLAEMLTVNDRYEVVQPQSILDLEQIFAKSKGIISMRLHALILGYIANKPIFGLSYNDKIAGWHKFTEIDREFWDLRTEINLPEAEFVSRMQSFLGKAAAGVSNEDKIKKLRDNSQLNFDYLKGWLN